MYEAFVHCITLKWDFDLDGPPIGLKGPMEEIASVDMCTS